MPKLFKKKENQLLAQEWLSEISVASRTEKEWRACAEKLIERYSSEATKDNRIGVPLKNSYNILYSNTQTLTSAIYYNNPKPDIRRRFAKKNTKDEFKKNLYRLVSETVERSMIYNCDVKDYNIPLKRSIFDSVLIGRGVIWVNYEPEIETIGNTEGIISEDISVVEEQVVEVIKDQKVYFSYVNWEDFRCSPARTWDEVTWVAKKLLLTRKDLKKRFGDKGAEVKLNYTVKKGTDADKKVNYDEESIKDKRGLVWEVWDKTNKQRIYVSPGYKDEPLSIEDDPLGLEGFFPCAEPLSFIMTNDTTVPLPEYSVYEPQDIELSNVSNRLNNLIKGLKYRGFYANKYANNLQDLSGAEDNTFIGVDLTTDLMQSGGLQGVFTTEPMQERLTVIQQLTQRQQELIQEIYEITGISDLLRGQSQPNETATAQNIKGKFGSLRIQSRQDRVQRFIKDNFAIMAEIICEHFVKDILEKITCIELPDPQEKERALLIKNMMPEQNDPRIDEVLKMPTWDNILEILRDDKLRSYTIDIETTATVFDDQMEEKVAKTEFMMTFTQILNNAMPLMQAQPETMEMVKELLLFGVSTFKVARSLEETIEETFNSIQQKAEQAAQQPKQPSPQELLAQAQMQKIQAETQATQAKSQTEQAKISIDQGKLQTEQQKAIGEGQYKQQELALKERDIHIKELEVQLKEAELRLKEAELRTEAQLKAAEIQTGQNINSNLGGDVSV